MRFLSLNPEAFGLDISDLCLRAAKLKKRGRFFDLVSWAKIEIKPGIIEDGEIKDQDALSENINQLLAKFKGERIKTKYVVASLPEKKAFLQVIQVPKMEEEELATAIPFEAENYVPLSIGDVYLDFQVVHSFSNNPSNLDVLIAALPKQTIEPYASALRKAGLVPKVLEVESQSIVRALIKNNLTSPPVFIIDFGRNSASFIIFSKNSLRFTSSIPISSYKLTQAISQELKIDIKEAEKLKIKHGLSGKTIKARKIDRAMNPLLIDLVRRAKKYIDYYHTHNGRITNILVCGGGANLKGLPDFISSELSLSAKIANPWINILPEKSKRIPKLSFEQSLGYTTALGLALRGAL